MSSIKFTSFGAAITPLSKIVVDKELDMGTYPIKTNTINEKTVGNGVFVDGLLIKDGVSNSPYRPQAWPTEELDWGDVAASNPVDYSGAKTFTTDTTLTLFTHSGSGRRYTVNLTVGPGSPASLAAGATIKVDGVTMITLPLVVKGASHTTSSFPVDDGQQVTITGTATEGTVCSLTVLQHTNTGIACGAKTFPLTEKWLAIGLDMKGLAATVQIHGVGMPYSDYWKYFPLAPSILKIPGGWGVSQQRPVIECYV